MVNYRNRVIELINAIKKANGLLFKQGAPIGSANYFKIREILAAELRKGFGDSEDAYLVWVKEAALNVGGGQLMQVNDLLLLESSCTDTLQDALNKGWRIIACCVQPDGRRPDYVLGRYSEERREQLKKKLESYGQGARRDA